MMKSTSSEATAVGQKAGIQIPESEGTSVSDPTSIRKLVTPDVSVSKLSDPKYLLTHQYQNASNLSVRQRLHDRFSTNKRGWHLWVFDQFDLSGNSRILELGCGTGTLWSKNAHRIPDGWDITLSDSSLGMLRDAQRNLHASQRRLKFAAVDAQSIPFGDKSFDAVIANHMLYHVPDITKTLSEIHRILKPGGRFYAATNGRDHMRELGELVRRFEPNVTFKTMDRTLSLENGLAEISRWFSKVDLRRYEDSLAITEADPLVAYVLSSISNARSVLVGDKLAEFIDFVQRELTLHGVIRVTKDAGIFEACREEG